MKKNLFPTILISVLLALWGLVLFGYNFSQAHIIGSSGTAKPTSGDTLKNGLVGWWTMDGADVTGNTTTDRSGNVNNGTRTATGTTPVVGKIGQAMKFSGDAARDVAIASSTSLNFTQALTMSAWIKTTDIEGVIINKDDVATNRQFTLYVQNSVISMYVFQTAAVYSNVVSSNLVDDGKWHHIVGTWDVNTDGKSRVYVDGILKGTAAVAITSMMATSRPVSFGDREVSPFALQGTIDDVRIYNRALSAPEVTALYKYGQTKVASSQTAKPTTGDTLKTGLMGWWTMDGVDITVNTTTDKSGQGNNGTRSATGGTSPTPGTIGQGMKFFGTVGNALEGNVNIPDQSYFSPPNNSMTITGWFKTTTSSPSRGTVVGKSAAGNYEWAVELNGLVANKLTFQLWQSSGAGYGEASSVTVANDGKWHFFAATIDYGVRQQLFFDGRLEGSNTSFTGSMTDLAANVEIGRRPDGNNHFNGSVDDVRIYNRALSVAETTALYKLGQSKAASSQAAAPTSGNTLKTGLVGWWTFDGMDVTANTTTDRSGQGSNGTRTAVTPVVGKVGQAMNFNGTSSKIDITQSTLTSTPFSASFWFKTTPSATGISYMFTLGAENFVPRIEWRGATGQVLFRIASTDYQYTNVINKPFNTWHLYTVVVPSTSITFVDTYIDGVLSESANVDTGSSFNPGTSWRMGELAGIYYPGTLDDVRVYNRVLSPAEITMLYKMGR